MHKYHINNIGKIKNDESIPITAYIKENSSPIGSILNKRIAYLLAIVISINPNIIINNINPKSVNLLSLLHILYVNLNG